MQVILFHVVDVTSKKNGKKYRIGNGISATGEKVDIILGEEQMANKAFAIPAGSVVNKEQLEDMFRNLPVVDVQFGQRGSIDSIEA